MGNMCCSNNKPDFSKGKNNNHRNINTCKKSTLNRISIKSKEESFSCAFYPSLLYECFDKTLINTSYDEMYDYNILFKIITDYLSCHQCKNHTIAKKCSICKEFMCYNCISTCFTIDHQCKRNICYGQPKNINEDCVEKYLANLIQSYVTWNSDINDTNNSSYKLLNSVSTDLYVEYIGNLEEHYQWNNYRKYIPISCGLYFNDTEIFCSADCLPPTLNFLGNEQKVYHHLSSFLKTLPKKSKYYIWKHALKRDKNERSLEALDMIKVHQMLRLLADILLVYIKFLDRKRNLRNHGLFVRLTMNCCLYLWMTSGPLTQMQFINQKVYFPNLLLNYSDIQPTLLSNQNS